MVDRLGIDSPSHAMYENAHVHCISRRENHAYINIREKETKIVSPLH